MTRVRKNMVICACIAAVVIAFGLWFCTLILLSKPHVVAKAKPQPKAAKTSTYTYVGNSEPMDGYEPRCKSGVLNTDKSDKYLLMWECRDHSFQAAKVYRYGH